jgi:hypothetical protein
MLLAFSISVFQQAQAHALMSTLRTNRCDFLDTFNLIIDLRLRQSVVGRRCERRNNTMYDLSIIWIALLLIVAVGTFLSTRLYTRFGKGNKARGNRLNTLESMLYQQ